MWPSISLGMLRTLTAIVTNAREGHVGDGGWLYRATCPETTADAEAQNDSQGFPDQEDR